MIIALTGFMGCGKSSVGRRLSELLCCPFIDLDSVIEATNGRSITEIFSQDGEERFRRMELQALRSLIFPDDNQHGTIPCNSNPRMTEDPENIRTNLVLALGGGTIMTPDCADLIHNRSVCIYLKASAATIAAHLEGESDKRPLLSVTDIHARIEELMELRHATYERISHQTIDVDGRSVDEIAMEIFRTLKS